LEKEVWSLRGLPKAALLVETLSLLPLPKERNPVGAPGNGPRGRLPYLM